MSMNSDGARRWAQLTKQNIGLSLIHIFISLFQKKTWKHKPKIKVHYGGGTTSREKDYDYNAHKKAQSDEIYRMLEKLKKSGYDSLTTEEKKSLFDASKR